MVKGYKRKVQSVVINKNHLSVRRQPIPITNVHFRIKHNSQMFSITVQPDVIPVYMEASHITF